MDDLDDLDVDDVDMDVDDMDMVVYDVHIHIHIMMGPCDSFLISQMSLIKPTLKIDKLAPIKCSP